MEPVSLTIGAMAATLVLEGIKKAGENAVDAGWTAVSRLTEQLKARFTGHGDRSAEQALVRVLDPPVGDQHLAALAAAIDRHADEDPAFAVELRELVGEAERGGVAVGRMRQSIKGDGNVQIGNASGSTFRIDIGRTDR